MLTSKKKYPGIVIDKCRSQGATIGIYFKACKLAGILERTILWAHLPYNASDWELLAHTDMDGNELEDSPCTVVNESQEAQEASTPIVSTVATASLRTHENLSCDEKRIYDFLTTGASVSTSDVAEYLKCSPSKARPILQDMSKKGVINEEGQGKAHKYFIGDLCAIHCVGSHGALTTVNATKNQE